MKKRLHALITALIVVYVTVPTLAAWALTSADSLMGLGMPAELASYISSKLISVNSSGNVVIPVASGKVLSVSNGDVASATSGGTLALQEATAAAACMGTLTCNGASDVVTSTTCATTGSRIFLTRTSLDTDTTGDFYVKSLSAGVSFTVACEASDTATLNWIIFHEAA